MGKNQRLNVSRKLTWFRTVVRLGFCYTRATPTNEPGGVLDGYQLFVLVRYFSLDEVAFVPPQTVNWRIVAYRALWQRKYKG